MFFNKLSIRDRDDMFKLCLHRKILYFDTCVHVFIVLLSFVQCNLDNPDFGNTDSLVIRTCLGPSLCML